MVKLIQKATASTRNGAIGLIKGIIACAFQNIAFMLPASLLYLMVSDLMNGGVPEGRGAFYIIGCVVCILAVFITS